MMWERLRVFIPGTLVLALLLSGTQGWSASDSGSEKSAEVRDPGAVSDGVAVLFLGREVIYDVGRGFCPSGYKEGNFDGEGDAPDCRMKYIVAEKRPLVASAGRI